MPSYQLLTDRTLAQSSAITPTTLIHIVYTGDPSQNPAGSSYKAELGQLIGIFSGASDTLVTGGTYSNGSIIFTNNSGGTFTVSGLTEPFTGGTVIGETNFTLGLTSEIISATTYLNLPIDINVTGGTYFDGSITFTNNTGGTFNVTGLTVSGEYLPLSGGTVSGTTDFTNGLNTNTISATTYLNLPLDGNVTGGTYSAGTITFTNNTGGTFNVTGLTTGDTTTITGATSVGTGVTIFDSVVDRSIKINSITGDTLEKITTSLSASTIQVGINEQNLTLWPLVVNGNRLIDGGVSYVSGLTFNISPLNYIIDGEIYNIPLPTQVTLNSGDSTFDRIDVIFADISGNTGVLEGTPSANPEKPIVDSDSQVEVTFVSIPANSTTPDINTFIIYNENSGPPSEWTFGSGGAQPTRISGNSTDTSYSGVTSIKVSGVTGVYTTFFRLTGSTILDTNQYATLQFAIKNLSQNAAASRIRIRFLSTGGTQNGNTVLMNAAGSAGYVQYSATNTSTWQLISIPLWRFYLTNTNVQVLEVAFNPIGTGAQSQARYYFDLIEFVEGTASSPPTNSWTTIKGDGATTITAPNPNATLTISGGTNIGSFISGTSTVVLNLDNNINLNSVSANTISATTYQNLPTDVRVTGGTYSAGTITFTNNTGGTFNVTGLTTTAGETFTGGTVSGATQFTNGLTANTLSATTLVVNGVNITGDTYVTGLTFNTSNYNLTIGRNDGVSFTDNLGVLAGDLTITGGTYNSLTGVGTFTNNTGGTFNVSGFLVGYTDVEVTGSTYNNNTFTFTNSTGGTFSVLFNTVTGLTSSGLITSNTISASTISATTIGSSGDCVDDIYISNIHSCSPLNINPLDEGNVYFGSTSGITVDVTNKRIGINNSNPQFRLDVSGTTSRFFTDLDSATEQLINISSQTTSGITYTLVSSPNAGAISMGIRGVNQTLNPGFGKAGDSFIYSSTVNNGLNIISDSGSGTDDYIRFYAGQIATTGNTPDIHIQGSGVTRGNVGIGTANPTEILDVSGKTKTINFQMTSGATVGYVLTSDATGNATWQISPGNLTFTGGSGNCITDFYVTNIHGCSPITFYDSIKSTGSTVSGLSSLSFGYQTSATTNYSHAEGYETTASGEGSHAEGRGTTASGFYSHAEGESTIASGFYSHAEGRGTTSSGFYSHAEGRETTTSADYSHSEGRQTIASGLYSHAEGFQTTASNDYSHAEGSETTASGFASHAEGYQTSATTSYSHAEGRETTASGQASHAEGLQTTASNDYSHAEGSGTTASGVASHAEGGLTTSSGNYSHAEGRQTTASGIGSHAEGFQTSATTNYSHAEGRQTKASGEASHAEGFQTSATTDYSHAEGYQTTASGLASHAEGLQTTSSGNYSHAEGEGTIASGFYSHAEGSQTTAFGNYSHSAGQGTYARGNYQSVIGRFNLTGDTTEGAFIIGNGSSSLLRNNLLFAGNSEIRINGNLNLTGNTSVVGGMSATTMSATTMSATTVRATTISATTVSATTYQNLPIASVIPVGTVLPWAGTGTIPTGWLVCSGQTVFKGQYSLLFSAIGGTYGPVGTFTFTLPNLSNRIPVGIGTNTGGYTLSYIGATGGDATITLTNSQIPKHKHVLNDGVDGAIFTTNGGHSHFTQLEYVEGGVSGSFQGVVARNSIVQTNLYQTTFGGDHKHTGNTGDGTTNFSGGGLGGQAHGNMQPYIVMRYIIFAGQ